MEENGCVDRMVISYLETLSKKAVFLKQQNIHAARIGEIYEALPGRDDIRFFFYDYTLYDIKDAYEPFMSWIRQAYESDFAGSCSVEEFVENCGVYSLQREVFCSYISSGVCTRKLEVMMNEYEYEEERIMESVYSSLQYIAGNRKLVMVIGGIHMAPVCVLHFLNRIFEREDGLRFIFTYGETFFVKDYCRNEWSILRQKAEEGKLFLETDSRKNIQNFDAPDKFDYREERMACYIKSLNNMVHLHTFRDAEYYFNGIVASMNRIDSKVSDEDKFSILELLGMVYQGMGDYKDVLRICEKMVPLFYNKSNVYREYIYHYFSAKAHLIREEANLTHKFCDSCRVLAGQMGDDLLLMNVDIIDTLAEFGSLKELFRCNFSLKIQESVLERAKKVGNENFLAYMYVFGYDNDAESVRQIGRGEKEPVYFNHGVEIAKRLGNRNLLLNAYMRNIILYSEFGFYQYVRQMYEKRLQIVDKGKPVKVAHMCGGLGYNAIILEDYAKADEYFRKGLEISIKNRMAEDIAETLYNMFMNYYVAGASERAIDCIELLLKVMKLLHIQGLKICNTTKMYGTLALAYYKQGQYMDCYYCINKMEMILSYVLHKQDEKEEEFWLEDLFLYHLCKANLFSYENNMEQAQEHFLRAYQYMKKNDGISFYSYAEYALFHGKFLEKAGRETERRQVLQEAYEYCITHNYPVKAALLQAELEHLAYDVDISFAEAGLPVEAIMDVSQYVGARIELEKRKKDIDFMMLCHNIMGREENNVSDVVKQTMNLIRNSFSFDRILFLENKQEEPEFTFASDNIKLNKEETRELIAFFQDYTAEFMAGRLDKSFQRYVEVTQKIGGDDIATIVGVPVYSGGMLKRIFVAATDVHRSFTENRKLPDYNDLEVIKFAVSQLDEEIGRIYSHGMIRIMNEKLEKAALTDPLTGIYNRMGLKSILENETADTGVLLYMDLDNFKAYNDTYGHSVGDSILEVFADIIRKNIGNFGYAIRYGGDEFVAVIPKQDEEFAEKIARNIQRQIREDAPEKIAVDGLNLTSSVGIAEYENAGSDGWESALTRADTALYYVKNNEKGNIAKWSQL